MQPREIPSVRGRGWPLFIPQEFWPRMEKGVWVSQVGTFDITDFTQTQTIGMLRNVHYVEELPDFQFREDRTPSPPRLQAVPPQAAKPPQFETRPDTPR